MPVTNVWIKRWNGDWEVDLRSALACVYQCQHRVQASMYLDHLVCNFSARGISSPMLQSHTVAKGPMLAPINRSCRAERALRGRWSASKLYLHFWLALFRTPSPEVQASDPHSNSQFLCQKFDLTFDQRDSTHTRSSILTPAAMKCMSPSFPQSSGTRNAKALVARMIS